MTTEATIGHLTLHGVGQGQPINGPVLRLRLERLLGEADLQPPGMTSGAILVVRQLRGTASPINFSRPSSTWADRLRARLATLHREAARPARGPIPSDASSVLFTDPAEMIACLTRDVLAGQARQRWYWQQLMPRVSGNKASMLAAAWTREAPFLPAALGQLKPARAAAAAALLDSRQVSQVVRALHASFDLPPTVLNTSQLDPVLAHSPPVGPVLDAAPVELTQKDGPNIGSSNGVGPSMTPPWERWLALDLGAPLTPPAHYLLGLGLTLYHAPALARTETFAQQSSAWLKRASNNHRAESSTWALSVGRRMETGGGLPPGDRSQEDGTDHQTTTQVPISQSFDSGQTAEFASPSSTETTGTRRLFTGPSAGNHHAASTDIKTAPEITGPIPRKNAAQKSIITGSTDLEGSIFTHEVQFNHGQPLPTEGVHTQLGGVLYLINLLLRLDLPVGWPGDKPLANYLSGWAIVETLARGLLGPLHAYYGDDPLWTALAQLDGRKPGTRVGATFPQPGSFYLPAKWLLRYASPEPTWIAAPVGSRLWLVDQAAGYLIADIPVEAGAAAKIAAVEVATYQAQGVTARFQLGTAPPLPPLVSGAVAGLSPATDWWLTRILGFVRYWLVRALGESTIVPDDLARTFLFKPGKLVVGRTHVDLYMSLDQINVPVRRAGLDFDPGWVPDLGRIVQFHFG